MMADAVTLPEDYVELKEFTTQLLAEIKAQAMLIEKLRHQVAGQKSWRYGSTSEQTKQLMLALEASEVAEAAMSAKMKLPPDEPKDRPKRRPISDHIPRNNIELLPPKDNCTCGGALRQIGEDITEGLKYVPERFVVNKNTRPRFACKRCEQSTQAVLSSRPIERGRPGPGLLAHVLVSKYADHLPVYRQSQIFERDGLDFDRSNLADWVGKTTTLLAPLADAIGKHIMKGKAIFTDNTPVNMLTLGTRRTKTGRLWVYARDERPWGSDVPPAAWYQFSEDRRGAHPKDHLGKHKGWMHADGYAGYEELYRDHAIKEVACMAHIRRKFVDVHRSQGSSTAEEAILRISQLYAVETEARGSPQDQRASLRQAKAKPIFDDLQDWLGKQLPTISGKSPLAQAIRYALTRTRRLRPYLANGILELDNNTAERAMRAIALGRKNYLFVGSPAGGRAAAVAYTLIETAKLNGVDPQRWLADIIARIPDYRITRVNDLLTWSFALGSADNKVSL